MRSAPLCDVRSGRIEDGPAGRLPLTRAIPCDPRRCVTFDPAASKTARRAVPPLTRALPCDPRRCVTFDPAASKTARRAVSTHAVRATASPNSVIICSRMMNFWTLPVTVNGKAPTNLT